MRQAPQQSSSRHFPAVKPARQPQRRIAAHPHAPAPHRLSPAPGNETESVDLASKPTQSHQTLTRATRADRYRAWAFPVSRKELTASTLGAQPSRSSAGGSRRGIWSRFAFAHALLPSPTPRACRAVPSPSPRSRCGVDESRRSLLSLLAATVSTTPIAAQMSGRRRARLQPRSITLASAHHNADGGGNISVGIVWLVWHYAERHSRGLCRLSLGWTASAAGDLLPG